jgi:hypothetical protein
VTGRPVTEILTREARSSVAVNLLASYSSSKGGFPSQPFDDPEISVASTGICTFSLLATRLLPRASVQPPLSGIRNNVDIDGILRVPRLGEHCIETSWGSSQCARALLASGAPPDISAAMRIIDRLPVFRTDQGWALRPKSRTDADPAFSFYPVLAISTALRKHLVSYESVRELIEPTVAELIETVTNPSIDLQKRLICWHSWHLCEAMAPPKMLPWSPDGLEDARQALQAELSLPRTFEALSQSVTVEAPAQPLWYFRVWPPALYLILRHVVGAQHVASMYLARLLVDNYQHEAKGWCPVQKRSQTASAIPAPYTWMTALGILAIHCLSIDIEKHYGGHPASWEEHAQRQLAAFSQYDFDIVISFGGPDREIAEEVTRELQRQGLRVFYDNAYRHELLGEDLTEYLQKMYFKRARYAVPIISRDFLRSNWARNWEWRSILARMQQQNTAYLLPYVVEDVDLPGLNPNIGYLHFSETSPAEFAAIVARKLRLG